MKKLIWLILIAAATLSAREKVGGYCQQGGHTVLVAGIQSSTSTPVQASYPGCTVRVFLTGTVTNANIYNDNNGTVKSNPFVADSTGYYYFYVDDGTYDLQFSGLGIQVPFTIGAISAFDPLGSTPVFAIPGLVPRAIGSKLYDEISVKDFGAVCDGVTDDTAALTLAAAQSAGYALHFTHGNCVTNSVTFGASTSLVFDNGAMLSPNAAQLVTILGDLQAGCYQIFSGAGTVLNSGRSSSLSTNCGMWVNPANGFTGIGQSFFSAGNPPIATLDVNGSILSRVDIGIGFPNGHLNTSGVPNSDTSLRIAIPAGSLSNFFTFIRPYASAPNCVANTDTLLNGPTGSSVFSITPTTTTVTINMSDVQVGTVTFFVHCIGYPN